MTNINHILTRNVWTVTNHDKVPLDPNNIKYHWRNDTKLTDYQHAQSLADDYDYTLAYRLDSLADRCLFLDLEATHSDIEANLFTLAPLVYCETSSHGGKHGLAIISDDLLKQYHDLLQQHTVFKSNVDKTAHGGLEIFTNHHFLSFTRNQITPPVSKNIDASQLLLVMTNMQTNQTFNTDIKPININDPLLQTAYQNALTFLQRRPNEDDAYLNRILGKIKTIYATDLDRSHADYRMLWTIYAYLKLYLFDNKTGLAYQNEAYQRADLRAGLLLNLAQTLANEYSRDKWFDHMIHNVNYLTYTSEQVIARADAEALNIF